MAEHAGAPHVPWLLAALALIAGLSMTWYLWDTARDDAESVFRADFQAQSREIAQRLEQRMATYEQVLRGAQGLLLASEVVTRLEFSEYVRVLRLEENYPGVQGIGVAEWLSPRQLASHEAQMRRQGLNGYRVWPQGERTAYSAISRIEPFTDVNLRAVGFDMYSEPRRRAAMERARDTGRAALTERVTLVQEPGTGPPQAGSLMYLPLYRPGMSTVTVNDRREALNGWVYAAFRMNDLMGNLDLPRGRDVMVRLYESEEASADQLMFDSAPGMNDEKDVALRAVETLNLGGRIWTLVLELDQSAMGQAAEGKPQVVATAGVIGSLLLALLIQVLASGRRRAVALANGMTVELRRARDELEVRVQERTADLRATNQALNNEVVERRRIEHELVSSRERLASVFDAATDGLVVQDREGRFIELNVSAEKMFGITAERMRQARSLAEFMRVMTEEGTELPVDQHPAHRSLKSGRPLRNVTLRLQPPDRPEVWVSVNTELLFDASGQVDMVVSNVSDVTARKASEELIWHQANYDALTGLPNRRLFQEHLETEMRRSRRTGLPLALIFLDLDRFKDVNDSLGHDVGDRLLKQAATRLRQCVRASDVVARLGGDEFTIILSELDRLNHVAVVAQNVLTAMAQPFELGIDKAYLSASVGITLYPQDAQDVDGLLKNADQAMYSAKNQGRNRYRYFTEAMQQAVQARTWLANELRTALTQGQFRVFYQPIVELANGRVDKAEALIRWQHPERGWIEPSVFIPIAEETGLIIEVGDWVFHEVVAQIKRWRDDDHRVLQVSINRSPVQFRNRSKGDDSWTTFLQRLGLPGTSIAVEITEGLLLDPNATVVDQLAELQAAGVSVSLDDFGTGYSALSYLKKFDIDVLKIDKSFIGNLAPDNADMALCEAIISMAHKLDIKVIAEGVETEAQRSLLAEAGCDYAQGYLFSRPVPAHEFRS